MVSESCCLCPWSSSNPSPGAAGHWTCRDCHWHCLLQELAAFTACAASEGKMQLVEHINHTHINTVGTKHKTETDSKKLISSPLTLLSFASCVCTADYSSSFHHSAAREILSLCPWKTQSQGNNNLQMPKGMIMCLYPQHLGFRLDTIYDRQGSKRFSL